MIAATCETIFWLALGLLAIQRLGFWARSPAAPRSPKPTLSNRATALQCTPVR
ncbi:hypothetical protein THL1_6010 (plasmid) [Pseudomonas sp. TCU-HL1]|nr:hypothetical protein THL1_3006 [Pseudomonas sp. TCU-HL1]AOE85567.1 hypothetical protein THL1_3019 [Pseudomonas sp. TCU-HL1]AOE88307.1 hypothetical protein THL1_6010 [Pseudomonas sp. TCU-HL1]